MPVVGGIYVPPVYEALELPYGDDWRTALDGYADDWKPLSEGALDQARLWHDIRLNTFSPAGATRKYAFREEVRRRSSARSKGRYYGQSWRYERLGPITEGRERASIRKALLIRQVQPSPEIHVVMKPYYWGGSKECTGTTFTAVAEDDSSILIDTVTEDTPCGYFLDAVKCECVERGLCTRQTNLTIYFDNVPMNSNMMLRRDPKENHRHSLPRIIYAEDGSLHAAVAVSARSLDLFADTIFTVADYTPQSRTELFVPRTTPPSSRTSGHQASDYSDTWSDEPEITDKEVYAEERRKTRAGPDDFQTMQLRRARINTWLASQKKRKTNASKDGMQRKTAVGNEKIWNRRWHAKSSSSHGNK